MHPDSLHVLADFDRTFTKAHVNGKQTPSLISVLRDQNLLDQEYSDLTHALYNQYAPLENDSQISPEEQKQYMHERRTRHFEILIEKQFSKSHIKQVIDGAYIELRDGAKSFIEKLRSLNVPLVFVSSSGLGADCIRLFLEQQGAMHDNIHIVSNEYERDENGVAIAVKQPIIHSLNKDETTLNQFPFYEKITDRKNILLLGDSIGDLKMSDGFAYNHRTTIGFLNDLPEADTHKKQAYSNAFDHVIEKDGSFDLVEQVFETLISDSK